MVFPLALAAASSTRTRWQLQPTTASIHGAPLPLPLHPQAKSHPSSPMPSVRYVALNTLLRPNTHRLILPHPSPPWFIPTRLGIVFMFILIAEATVPAIYQQSFGAVDPTNSSETSVNSLSRVLSTSSLPAATVDKVRHRTQHTPLSHCVILILVLSLVPTPLSSCD